MTDTPDPDADRCAYGRTALARPALSAELQKHTGWEVIGEQLDVEKQSAHERYKETVAEWQLALQEPYYPAPPGAPARGLPLQEAAYAPTTAGQRPDAWVREHIPPHRKTDHPVTDHLPVLSTAQEMVQVPDALKHLYGDMRTPPDPLARARLTERKAALLDRIVAEEGRTEAAQQAEEARAVAVQLRAEARETGEGTS
ncbi:hypothetical protein EV562_113233 [Streptomyces sp. BK208]|uniref:hypothetical protein n=1 Tax=Streptomyces sp. BK208 TaxID=2512150 RepID=UPI00105B61A9|nr:hypothetical protein [Streptomyces sp. BK208]TDT29368.1 hypothetical protein EV562_113233 [Streptomyces sp. BK208]